MGKRGERLIMGIKALPGVRILRIRATANTV